MQQQNEEERQLSEEEVEAIMPKEIPYFVIMKSSNVESTSKDTKPLKEQWPSHMVDFVSSEAAQDFLDEKIPNARDQRIYSIVERIRYE